MKIKIAFHFACFLLFAFLLTAASGSAQIIAYRQNDLASNLPGLAHILTPLLQNPRGMAFQPGQPFLIANSSNGRALPIDATGGAGLLGFVVPNVAGSAPGTPVGIVAGCGGYGSSTPSNRGTALVNIVAQSGAVSHATTVSVTVQ